MNLCSSMIHIFLPPVMGDLHIQLESDEQTQYLNYEESSQPFASMNYRL